MTDRIYELIDLQQLVQILNEVHSNHSWPIQGRRIKYVDLHYDNRGAHIFTIGFRHNGGESPGTIFTSVNRMVPETLDLQDVRLFDEVWSWLEVGRCER